MYLVLALGVSAFILSLILTPLVRDCCRRWGIVDVPDKARKFHTHPIPRVGGIAIVASYLGAYAILVFHFNFSPRLQQELFPQVLNLMPAALVIFVTGLIDDLRGLR